VAGICLPLLLLIGLKRGLVEKLIEDIVKSPTSREISLWVVQEKAALTPAAIADLVRQHPGIEMVIPNIKKVVGARHGTDSTNRIDSLSLAATDACDPYLAIHKVPAPTAGERALVLSRRAAEVLHAKIGDVLQLDVSRSEGAATSRVQIDMSVKGILETGSRDTLVGYVHWKLLDRIEEYQSGEAIPEFGWPAFQMPMKPRYPCFLCFSQTPLAEADGMHLKTRGLRADSLSGSDPNDRRRDLYGLLAGNAAKYVYLVRANTAAGNESVPLSFAAREIEAMLDTNVIAIPWSEPLVMELAGSERRVIGLTLQPRWLKGQFVLRDGWFETDEPEFRVVLPAGESGNQPSGTVAARLSAEVTVPLAVRVPPPATNVTDPNKGASSSDPATARGGAPKARGPLPDPNSQSTVAADANQVRPSGAGAASSATAGAPERKAVPAGPPQIGLAVVPATLLAHIQQLRSGKARFDKDAAMFVRPKSSVAYYQARVFAKTLDDVLTLYNDLGKQFAVDADLTRILEMNENRHTLTMLVNVVGSVVFLFGLVTVTSLLSDITARKKGDIGILSCMGISRWAVVYFVIIRATLIGAIGCLVAYVSSLVMSMSLDRWFGVRCVAPVYDVYWVLPFSIVCCWAGAIIPAARAALLDPVRCLREAKER
jgi:ABC-type lipoprotein release transport system permease subunit